MHTLASLTPPHMPTLSPPRITGITTAIHSAKDPAAVAQILDGSRDVGTVLLPKRNAVSSHK